jgi:pimeloyl-ACP methyl ester carboxylesterase
MDVKDYTLQHHDNRIPWRLFTPNAEKDYCVLWVQGWSSSMDSHREGVERMVKASNTTFATLDYAGHGLSDVELDDSTRQQQHEELVAVFDELKQRGFEKIIVIGGSFGGYMTALLTGVRPVHAAVLRCPANYPNEEWDVPYKDTVRARSEGYAEYMKTGRADDEMRASKASAAIANYDGFTYILEHEFDEVVPAKVPQHYFAIAKHGNYLIIPNTPHSPKTSDNPTPRYAYIEHIIVAIIEAVKLQDNIK